MFSLLYDIFLLILYMQHVNRGATSSQTLLVTPTEQSSAFAQTNTRARVHALPRAHPLARPGKRKLAEAAIDVRVVKYALFLSVICCRICQAAPGPPVSKSRNVLDLALLGLMQRVTVKTNSDRPSSHKMNQPRMLLMASVRIY